MTRPPLVSVIVLNHNNEKLLEACLKSVFRSNYPNLEVVLVDNASTDGSIDFIKKRLGKESSLEIVQNSENLGYAGGNNAGIEFAEGDYLVFLNNDTEVDENWLWELVNVLESDYSIGAAQSKLISMYDRKRLDSAGGFIDCFGFSIRRGFQEDDAGQYDEQDEIFYAAGAAFAIKRSVLSEVGFFDDDYFLYYEEADLCWRIWLRGYRIIFAPKSVVFHVGGASTFRERAHKNLLPEYHNHKNQITTLLKNYEILNLIKYTPTLIFLKVFSDFISFRSDRFVRLRGILYNIRNLDKIWNKRTKIQKNIRRNRDTFLFKKEIVKSFNLKRLNIKKTKQ